MDNTIQPIRLRDFNSRIASVLRNPDLINCWVIADLSDVAVRGGHCYAELIDKDPDTGKTFAKIRGIIWANRFPQIKYNFESITKQHFGSGIKVMLQVSINFHEVFGLSLIINDINPEFTLGDMELQRRQIIDRLTKEGIINLNKELPMPLVPQRIAIVSAEGAAGYGDFLNQLHKNKIGAKFYTALFTAKMQGTETSPSVRKALARIYDNIDLFDCVVIIRGGGATSDLNSFDDYDLAAYIAQFPIPIITGIGHERDNTVIDYVSHLRVKTPTAAAEWLILQAQNALDKIDELSHDVVRIAREYIAGCSEQLKYFTSSLPLLAKNKIEQNNTILNQYAFSVPSFAKQRIDTADIYLTNSLNSLKQAISQRIKLESMRIERYSDNIQMLSPQNTLKRGYSLTMINGKNLDSLENVAVGDEICTITKEGKITSIVNSKNIK